MAKPVGCTIFFVNVKRQVLLFLRDNKPDIPYPNMWDALGGHMDPGETPADCIQREMREELGIELHAYDLYRIVEFPDRDDFIYWKFVSIAFDRTKLLEGQELRWFSREKIEATDIAYGFKPLLLEFLEYIQKEWAEKLGF